jgi:hypothetical protein
MGAMNAHWRVYIYGCCFDVFGGYHQEGNKFLDQVVTGDETWVSHIIPEMKKWKRRLQTGSTDWRQISTMQAYRNSSHDTSAWIFMTIM